MDLDAHDPGLPLPAVSQVSSHFALLEPTSGATLFELETARREGLRHRGTLMTGSAEIDEGVLLGGFQRGQVAGVSAEEAEFGVLVGLHTVAHAAVFGVARKATIITTLAPAAILPMLRDVIKVQVQAKFGPTAGHRQQEVNGEVRRCLELISVSRVFDVEGLWEVIGEIETPPSPITNPSVAVDEEEVKGTEERVDEISPMEEQPTLVRSGTPRLASQRPVVKDGGEFKAKAVLPSLRPPKMERMEVGDSEEDEDEELSSPSPSPSAKPPSTSPQPPSSNPPIPPMPLPSPPTAQVASAPIKTPTSTDKQEETSHIPDIIIITHFSSLLTNLFTRSADNRTSAHTTLQLLSSHLRYLSRSSAGPLIMLLNTMSTSSSYSSTTTSASTINTKNTNAASRGVGAAPKNKHREPTLRSIFNPGPPGKGGEEGVRRHVNTKPAFGVTFAQFLDLHLLCTRVPRTRSDAETLFAPGGNTSLNAGAGEVKYSWVVEVLLDELGVWEWDDSDGGDKKGGNDVRWTRRNREQRWGAVDLRSGVRLVDVSFRETRPQGPLRLAAGFGGPHPRGL
ncbi:uncharacterized protein GGS22DRAFT_159614 [Annulohypoxylon maeteangense]|uniref:uncharacterized protein n=1 Tax=Annulohypoxylon maeteangense TaxID=1927788 RepID=UPI00200740C5|nr:uncharacterized protein GGS22DRAFT_159614 [Annulohypoxylon maeteangense]KAI0886014.1 hypothetical protein GGS22DRAFT_159614 [Annulohypoxylon maeteangense]